MWIPIVLGVFGVVSAGAALYKKFERDGSSPKKISLGSFAIWGRPESGKTSFIRRLQGKEPCFEKEATISKEPIKDIRLDYLNNGTYVIDEVCDMPGTSDRRSGWLELVVEKKHLFYIINLEKLFEDKEYQALVKSDLRETVKVLDALENKDKRVNIIASHVDRSKWQNHPKSSVNNVISEDIMMRQILESKGNVSGYFYAVNIMDKKYFNYIMQGIVNDIV